MNEAMGEIGGRSLRRPHRSDATSVFAAKVPWSGNVHRPTQIDVGDLLRILFKWKWLILTAVIVGVALAIAATMLSTRVYRSVATLEINTSPIEVMGNNRGVQPKMRGEDQFLQTQFGLLKSRSLAERVATTLNLGNDASFVQATGSAEQKRRAATYKLVSNLRVEPLRGSNLVALSYTDVDPERATRIVNAFANGFIDSTAERRYGTTAFARNFLQGRLNATRERLEESERQLVNYARSKGIVQLNSGGGQASGRDADSPTGGSGDSLTTQSLLTLNGALSNAIGERIAAEQRYRQAVATSAAGDILQNPTITGLRSERARLEADYRERLATFKPDYPDMIALRTRITEIGAALSRENGDVSSSLRSAYLAASGREAELREQVASLRSNVLDLRNRGIGYTILQREVETNRGLYDALLQRYKEIGVVGGLGESQAVVVDTALPPRSPFQPNPIRNLLIGIVAGLVIGMAIAFGIEFIDDTIKSAEDVGSKLHLPLLGLVPRMEKRASIVDELANPRSEVAEAYYSVLTALTFTSGNVHPKSLLVTSSRASEGKSSTSLALAQNFARTGLSVLLIDADLRKPSFLAKTADSIGLSRLLCSNEALGEHIVGTNTPRLSLLPSGLVPPNPAELLATRRIHQIIAEAMSSYDMVIIDAPPVLGLADAPVLGSICEATLLVIEAASIRRAIVLNAIERLTTADARLIGVVLTKYNPKTSGYGYGYGYGDGYGGPYGSKPRTTPMLDIAS
ncbi:GumC family protein [Sphingomonas qomolangmaensis]|uniref:non-specific protein-tyrosine kinase n=1 Tax=Sphingomonas qomolangmaensis TaxID=2918765 RepID=A0ABY5LA35_9SPHN|nr:polysaccharide biosynthesis tyrosine autokinase [Sphingomonas qomolangmaensis]UUL82473.1 polysaccharide biosynthesis tyrosine autokinase [Sphingomonas qomolangmaensis]